MIAAGVLPAVPDADSLHTADPRHIGTWIQACDLTPGMHVQDDDGRWGVVAGPPSLARHGKVRVPVWLPYHYLIDAAADIEPEQWPRGWKRLVRARTPEMQRAYVEAVETAARNWGDDREHYSD